MLENDDNLKWTKPKFFEICFFVSICLKFRMEQSKKTEESGVFFSFLLGSAEYSVLRGISKE